MKQVVINQGNASVANVSKPIVQDNSILVRVVNSCISAGTEMSSVKSSGTPLWKKAIESPAKVKLAVEMATTKGIGQTVDFVKGKAEEAIAVGYSNAGIVEEVGKNIKDIRIGDRVACAGARYAFHAEYVTVPRNLVVKIPDSVSFEDASTATVGAIAMQGIRRLAPAIGETFVVIGLGIIGQLTVQILKANGCRVIGTDISKAHILQAEKSGLDFGFISDHECMKKVQQTTNRNGADGVVVTAASASSEILSTAFQMCRKKGRVVLVGDVGLNIKRNDIYPKELDFYISTSYGPGRYDKEYEEDGHDYPIAYVRWTENRNMEAFLQLIGEKKVNIQQMISKIYPIDDAKKAYDDLKNPDDMRCVVLFEYPKKQEEASHNIIYHPGKGIAGKINVALIGAGNFAKATHLPNLMSLDEYYHLRAVMTRDGVNGMNTAKRFCADYATSDYQDILKDDTIDLVLITTPHNLHKEMVMQALSSGKNVFVEKPLCLTREELCDIKAFYQHSEAAHKPVLMTGFNRRFSKHAVAIRKKLETVTEPIIINYRMNAGYIPLDDWVHSDVGGGRNVGEACHIYDLFAFLTDSKAISVQAQGIGKSSYYSPTDNFSANILFENGSVANLIYTAMGSKDVPKELMEIYVDGKIISLNDYKEIVGHGIKIDSMKTRDSEKGQKEELIALSKCLLEQSKWPISLEEQMQAMNIAFDVEQQIRR